MLKLINSFCRLKITCESIKFRVSVNVKSITSLDYDTKRCSNCIDTRPTQCQGQVRQYSSSRKRIYVKIPPLSSNELESSKQMGELKPNVNHVSIGGEFNVSNDKEISLGEDGWCETISEATTPDTSHNGTTVPANFRVWETCGKKSGKSNGNGFRFKVLSYNVLAQYLLECHPYLYTDCIPQNLKWKVRSSRLYEEIVNLDPDIICLQEVQANHIDSFYSKFEEIGYHGIFKQKTGQRYDGCAIYYKRELFEMDDFVSVEFYQPELPILNRDNIGIVIKLVSRSLPNNPIVVATTHLLYNPKRTDVRLAQMKVLLAEIDRFAYKHDREVGHLPVILTGDFNSTPESAVITLLDKGHVSVSTFRDNSDWKKIEVTDNCQHLSVYLNRQKGCDTAFNKTKMYHSDYSPTTQSCSDGVSDDFNELFNSGSIGHSLQLTSVYNKFKSNGEEEASTFQDYCGTVDYMYFSRYSNLRLLERLRLPAVSECNVLGRLPNDVYGSDHLALAAVFELTPVKSSL